MPPCNIDDRMIARGVDAMEAGQEVSIEARHGRGAGPTSTAMYSGADGIRGFKRVAPILLDRFRAANTLYAMVRIHARPGEGHPLRGGQTHRPSSVSDFEKITANGGYVFP